MQNVFVQVSGKEVTTFEFYKDKCIEYDKYIDIQPPEEFIQWNLRDSEKFDAIVKINSSASFNPYFDAKAYLHEKGYKINENSQFYPFTGFCLIGVYKI